MSQTKWAPLALFVFAAVLLGPTAGQAQFTDPRRSTGAPLTIYGGSSIDSVNLASGNLQIAIPLLHLPGRGLDMDILLTYNSKIWLTTEHDDPYYGPLLLTHFDGSTNSTPSIGWGLGHPRMGSIAGGGTLCVQVSPDGTCTNIVQYLTWVTNDGTRYVMGNDNGPQPQPTAKIYGYWSFNGSYIRYPGISILTPLFYKDGVRVVASGGNSQTLVDTNGNSITCSQTNCTDTLGRLINFNYVSGNLQTLTYHDSSGATQTISFAYQTYTVYYPWASQYPYCWPGSYGGMCASSNSYTKSLLTSVTLPNGRGYSFQYLINSDGSTTGEIIKVTLPTGGYIRYTYGSAGEFDVGCGCNLPGVWLGQDRVIASRIVSVDGTAATEKTWSYSIASGSGINQVTDPLGNIQSQDDNSPVPAPTRIDLKSPSGTILKTTLQSIAYDSSTYNDPNPDGAAQSNPRIASRTTILQDTNQQSQVVFSYGSFGNVTQKSEYDWGSGGPGLLFRRTVFTYLPDVNPSYAADSVHILDRISSRTVYDSASNQCKGVAQPCAQTTFSYDTGTLATTSNVIQHDYTNYPSSFQFRGNLTQTSRWLNTTGAWLNTGNAYNDVGNLLQTTDPGGHTTSFSYTDNFYNFTPPQPTAAFVTQITRPVTGGVSHVQRTQYYFNAGLPSAKCGENFPPASTCTFGLAPPQPDYATFSYDGLNRLLAVSYGDAGQASLAYNETALPITITETTKITATLNHVQTTKYDGLGRTSQLQLNSDPDGIVYTDTTYDALGRKATVSNPYRSTAESTYGITNYSYDALNRVTKLIPPDGNSSSNNVTTSYSGNCPTVTDEATKKRKSCMDGLGRLTQVWEDPGGLNYETDYQYDALDNLTSVVQNGSRQRTFIYNSLSQLTSASNPESGTTTYTYDNNGNVQTKLDARNITITYGYDALNGLTGRTYSNGDPAVSYSYDQAGCLGQSQCFNIGRRTGTSDAAGSEAWSYDTMGRVLTDQRTTNSVTKSTVYAYNLDGSAKTITYPSNRTITYAPGGAGRPLSAKDDGNSINYALSATYAAQGALASTVLGQTGSFTGINLNLGYDKRLQPTTIRGWSTNGTVFDLAYNFNLGSSDNGNVMGITNNRDGTRSETFSYDSLNRILVGETTSTYSTSPGNCWGEAYVYDNQSSGGGAWGNLTNINKASSAYNGCTQEGLNISAATNNQISGFCYDAAGNLLAQSAPPCPAPTYSYNAENQLTSTAGVTYTYDGDGKRVEKSNGTLYWYGVGADVLDETDLAGNLTNEYVFFGGKRVARRVSGGNIYYYFADHLGTSRVITNATGTVCYDADFYPFGGERVYTNTCAQNYKFTGKERDLESNLDNFGARYDSSGTGRFLSVDPGDAGAPEDPQSWNAYAYGRNNPLIYVDPTGRTYCKAGQDIYTRSQLGNSGPECVSDDEFEKHKQKYSDEGYYYTVFADPSKDPTNPKYDLPISSDTKYVGGSWESESLDDSGAKQAAVGGVVAAEVICAAAEPCGAGEASFGLVFLGTVAVIDIYRHFSKGGQEQERIRAAARDAGVDVHALGAAIEAYKEANGIPPNATLSYKTILQIAMQLKSGDWWSGVKK